MKKARLKRLAVSSEMIRNLGAVELGGVVGGALNVPVGTTHSINSVCFTQLPTTNLPDTPKTAMPG